MDRATGPGSVSRKENQAKLACAFSGLTWGLFWIPLRGLHDAGVVGAWATVTFYLVCVLALLPFLLWRWRRVRDGGLRLQVTAAIAGVSLVFYADAVVYTEVMRAMLLYYLTPVWGTIMARVWLGEPITRARWAAIAFGLAGMLVIFGIDEGFPWPRNVGDWMGLGGGFLWAVTAVRMRGDTRTGAIEYTTVYFAWGLAVALFIAFLPLAGLATAPSTEALTLELHWVVPVLLLVVIPGSFAAMWGTPHLNPGIVGILFMTEISVGTATVAIWAGEPFGAREIVGVLLISAAGLAESVRLLAAWRRAARGRGGP